MGLLNFLGGKKRDYNHVIDVDDRSFKTQVIQRSYKTPVVVGFWRGH